MANEREVPEGYRLEWQPAGDEWKLADLERGCRMKGCGKPAVAALRRRHRGRNKFDSFRWWYYCADHLYGRKIEDGVVKSERLVEIPAEPSSGGSNGAT